MAYAINLRSDNDSAGPLELLWDKFGKLENVPSMRALGYPPHIRSQLLLDAHTAIHSNIDTHLCRPNYQPSIWVPHSSLATSVSLERAQDVLELMDQPFDPIEVVFDVIDYASYPPVTVLEEVVLKACTDHLDDD